MNIYKKQDIILVHTKFKLFLDHIFKEVIILLRKMYEKLNLFLFRNSIPLEKPLSFNCIFNYDHKIYCLIKLIFQFDRVNESISLIYNHFNI